MQNKRILVVDDSATEREQIGLLLRTHGAIVEFANDGQIAIDMCSRLPFDLIIMDIVMPGVNGFQATRSISKNETTKNIPIIICTSKDQESDKIWGMKQGARCYITKPIDQVLLVKQINECLSINV